MAEVRGKRAESKKNINPIKKFWDFLWKEDSFLSWIILLVLAFVLIKFIVFPILGLLMGTTHPIVAVISGSMDHRLSGGQICGEFQDNVVNDYSGDFDDWWHVCGDWYEVKSITKDKFMDFPLKNGFRRGDIILLKGEKSENINIGDVIVFRASNRGDPIIHRVVSISYENNQYYFQTKGDHNPDSNPGIGEDKISYDRIIGVSLFKIPLLGYVKIVFVETMEKVRSLF